MGPHWSAADSRGTIQIDFDRAFRIRHLEDRGNAFRVALYVQSLTRRVARSVGFDINFPYYAMKWHGCPCFSGVKSRCRRYRWLANDHTPREDAVQPRIVAMPQSPSGDCGMSKPRRALPKPC